MRFGSLLALLALSSGLHVACSSDGTLVDLPNARDGLNGGSGSPYGRGRVHDADASAEDDAGDVSNDASATTPVRTPITPAPTPPETIGDAATGSTTDSAAPAPDAAAQATIAGCACGCADPCLTDLIVACKTPTGLVAAVCPKVPATCACEATCTPAPPAPPSLDTCIAQFILTGK